ncbi:hypothetical protein KRR40_36285 [Niabella defluvii]|nr:hypothetical protein KRR40_36285 [Niabella sp. I65]
MPECYYLSQKIKYKQYYGCSSIIVAANSGLCNPGAGNRIPIFKHQKSTGKHGAVVSAHPLASQAGLLMLKREVMHSMQPLPPNGHWQ